MYSLRSSCTYTVCYNIEFGQYATMLNNTNVSQHVVKLWQRHNDDAQYGGPAGPLGAVLNTGKRSVTPTEYIKHVVGLVPSVMETTYCLLAARVQQRDGGRCLVMNIPSTQL